MTRIWDPLLRLFHWSLVISFAVAWVASENADSLHEWSGYAAAAIIGVRLIWGLIGPQYARFSQFVKGPQTVISYMKEMRDGGEKRYLGHNPAGGAMVMALLVVLLATAGTGWLLTWPQYSTHDGLMSNLHGAAANIMMTLVIVHVGGVFLASWRHKENLARAMVTGDKRAAEPDDIT